MDQSKLNKDIALWHKQVFDIFEVMFANRIVTSYIGPFDKNILISLAFNLRNNLWDDATQAKKFFKIFIELAHNIASYSIEKIDDTGSGTIIISEYLDFFKLYAGNLVDAQTKDFLCSKINLINSFNREQLRELKRSLLRQPANKLNSGNIGLVQVALVSRYPLEFEFFPVKLDNLTYYFYIIAVRIDKKFQKK